MTRKGIKRKIEDLSEERKSFLSNLAESIHNRYRTDSEFNPFDIVDRFGIGISIGQYGTGFEGRLEFEDGEFHIFLNDQITFNRQRLRFTLAHELGHFFIDEHRNALVNGMAPAHSSFTGFASNNIVEKEADFFAACLLLPERRIRTDYSSISSFSFEVIDQISRRYDASRLATLFRLYYLDIHPMMIVRVNADSPHQIKWVIKSDDFYYFPKHKLTRIPEDSVLYSTLESGEWPDSTQEGWTGDWFEVSKEKPLYEHLLNYSNFYLAILWTD